MALSILDRSFYVMLLKIGAYFCLFVMFSGHSFAQLARYQKHDQIYKVAHEFIEGSFRPDQDIEITLGKLDNRLRLTQCSKGLEASWSASAIKTGNVSIGILCTEQAAWKVFITAHIKEFKKVYTVKQALLRGDVLNAANVRLERQAISSARNGYIIDLDAYSGYIVKRSLRIGDILAPKYLVPPKLIKRGTKVTLLARGNGIEVRMKGMAMSDGAEGDIIKIRNLSSKKIVDATVIALGVAQVHL